MLGTCHTSPLTKENNANRIHNKQLNLSLLNLYTKTLQSLEIFSLVYNKVLKSVTGGSPVLSKSNGTVVTTVNSITSLYQVTARTSKTHALGR